mmetsp:Transcript_10366/g.12129  ORF Transcript_10366/g.12129 Transcript_10366/m.12129 type:complete len:155 (-) Transcript_10366:145-609(-)|eukprot:CAMPEP_0197847496 /NCGR_PEP_ID=MMETSP1438-20131217/6346_1 /TAXON_ID=1461541 /ORGANISM="Pterosperma sp., Strain CCMP1384" /LENGTH=154 /DNA_ID=CAMNT_0043459437 /DNA_START=87 /DNA_END=551 /DNA_ORIENTATION=-
MSYNYGYNDNPLLENFNKHAKDVQKMKYKQDLPPPGRFPAVQHGAKPPLVKAPSGAVLIALSAAIMGLGMYKIGQGNHKRREIKTEKHAARQTLVPLLQAEEDMRFHMLNQEFLKLEASVMKDVPGWEVGKNVYHSGKWYPPYWNDLPGYKKGL